QPPSIKACCQVGFLFLGAPVVLIRPVGDSSARSALTLDRDVNIATEEEGKSPVKATRERATQIAQREVVGTGQSQSVCDAEIDGAARAIRSLIGCGKILCTRRTIKTGCIAGTSTLSYRAGKEVAICAAVNETRIAVGRSVVGCAEISCRRVRCVDRPA